MKEEVKINLNKVVANFLVCVSVVFLLINMFYFEVVFVPKTTLSPAFEKISKIIPRLTPVESYIKFMSNTITINFGKSISQNYFGKSVNCLINQKIFLYNTVLCLSVISFVIAMFLSKNITLKKFRLYHFISSKHVYICLINYTISFILIFLLRVSAFNIAQKKFIMIAVLLLVLSWNLLLNFILNYKKETVMIIIFKVHILFTVLFFLKADIMLDLDSIETLSAQSIMCRDIPVIYGVYSAKLFSILFLNTIIDIVYYFFLRKNVIVKFPGF